MDFDESPLKEDDNVVKAEDPLIELNIGNKLQHRPMYTSALLEEDFRKLVKLLKKYKDCFAWNYHEMSGLGENIVEYELLIIKGFAPHKQPQKRFPQEVILLVKEEIE